MKQKFANALSLALIMAMLFTSLALADNTVPDGDGMEPVVSQAMNFGTVCADSTTTQTSLVRVNRNGNAGTPQVFKDGSTVTVTVLSVSGAGLSAGMDASNTIALPSNWGTLANNSESDYVSSDVTLIAGAAGSFSGSVAYRGSGVNSSNANITRDAPMSVTATIVDCTPVDSTPPDITYEISGTLGNNGWYTSDVFVDWTVNDSESEVTIDDGCVDTLIDYDTASETLSCSASSAGGSAGPVTVTIKRDATSPSISGSASPAANGAGWNNSDVAVSFSCDDNLSGVASCGPDATLSTEGAGQSVPGTVVDNAGNSAGTTVGPISLDKTAPTISASINPAVGSTGWYNSTTGAPTVSFSCNDTGGSGLAGSCPSAVTLGEGVDQSVSGGPVSDVAGNNSGIASISDLDVDLTAPSVSVTGVSNGATYTLGSVPAAGCSTNDALSGVATNATLSVSGGPVGSVTASCNGALDNAGNSGAASATYSVIYSWSGFFQPIDNNGVFNVVNAGRTIPVKFSLGGDQGLAILAAGSPSSTVVACPASATVDTLEETTTATSGLRYDASANQYIYNWKTLTSYAGTCRRLTVTLVDGTTHTALFKFTR
jgi:hypothetical protein